MAMMSDELSERDEVEALLPWYVTGRLDARERARVERYVREHPEVQAHMALAREESDATVTANEAIHAPGREALDRLLASVAAAPRPQPHPATIGQKAKPLNAWLAGRPPPHLSRAAAVAAL
jgi:anti-sigma factor RsiW